MKKTKGITGKEQAKTLPGGGIPSIVVNQIDVRPFGRREQDIPSWRNALRSAESIVPRRQALYDLYADVDLDGHVEAVTSRRRDAVTTANWQFIDKDGKPVDEINQLIDSIGFNDMLEEIINSKFWGYTILEPTFHRSADGMIQMEPNLIPRLNYRPEKGIVAYDHSSEDGINIREGIYAKTIMEVGRAHDLGLYLKAAPFQILKRGGLGDWALFVQVFGNPIVDATWDGFDEKQRLMLLEAINALGSGGAIVRPAGTDVTLLENKTNANGDLQDKFLTFLNQEISKALLGTTETTQSSSSSGYAQAEIHQNQDERKNESDIDFTRRILNSRFTKILTTHGFDLRGGRFIIEGESNELTVKESFDIHMQLKKEGLPIDDDFFYDTYGIPKPDNYDQIVAEKRETNKKSQESRIKNQDNEDPDLREEEEEQENLTFARRFIKLFSGFFGQAPEAEAEGAETVMTCCGSHRTITLADDPQWSDDALIRRIAAQEGKEVFDAGLFTHTVATLLRGFRTGWDEYIALADLGFTYNQDDPAIMIAFEQNLFRFSAGKTLAEVQELNRLFRSSRSFEEFYRKAKAKTDVFNKGWLQTEYTSAVLTGQNAATYHRLMAQAETFPYWMYKTAGDNLVREEHAKINGLTLPYNDPRWKKIYPPNGWNCRCYVVPRMKSEVDLSKNEEMRAKADAFIASDEFAKNQAQGWGVNRAMSGEVYTADQQYIRKQPGKAAAILEKLGHEDFGLQPYDIARKAGTLQMPQTTRSREDFFEALERLENEAVIRDYANRPLVVNPDSYNTHTTNTVKSRMHRTELLEAMASTLSEPDEVWLNGRELDNMVFIRYFDGKTIVSVGNISGGKMNLATWFELVNQPNVVNRYRSGLLVLAKNKPCSNSEQGPED